MPVPILTTIIKGFTVSNPDPGARENMRRVSASNPCPVGTKSAWCLVAPDGTAAICQRVESAKKCGEAGWLHSLVEPAGVPPTLKKKPTATAVNWTAEAKRYAANLNPGRKQGLAALLKLPVEALDALPMLGFNPDANGANFVFPEMDAAGNVIGLNRRFRDGSKKAMHGSKRGLTLPAGWRENPGPVFVVEGPTDAAADTAAELSAVGRPSNSGGVSLLAELFEDLDPGRDIIIVGENDRKDDGSWPGRDGAESVARGLALRLRRPILWALPPDGSKDVREWLTAEARGAAPWSDRGRELLAHLIAAAVRIDPPGEPLVLEVIAPIHADYGSELKAEDLSF